MRVYLSHQPCRFHSSNIFKSFVPLHMLQCIAISNFRTYMQVKKHILNFSLHFFYLGKMFAVKKILLVVLYLGATTAEMCWSSVSELTG